MPRTRRRVPVSSPSLGYREIHNLEKTVRSGWISSRGAFLDRFEAGFSDFVGGRYGIAVTSGTSALHLALAVLGVGPGDEVIVPDFTMIACVNAVLYTGAKPVLADIDPKTLTLSPVDVERRITRRTKVIMPVHVYGHPADMDPILKTARDAGASVVEDAAEAHGALYRGQPVGSIGDLGCFSFYANKLITTGEGGMIVTNSRSLADRARKLRDLSYAGRQRDYHHDAMGFNYRMTNLQAAVGVAQLAKIRSFVAHRRRCAQEYSRLLGGIDGLKLPYEAPWAKSVYWMYNVLIEAGESERRRIMQELIRCGIETRVCFWPLHLQPFLRQQYGRDGGLVVSTAAGKSGLNLPSGNGITLEQVRMVAHQLRSASCR
jgi:perosamine synthetase